MISNHRKNEQENCEEPDKYMERMCSRPCLSIFTAESRRGSHGERSHCLVFADKSSALPGKVRWRRLGCGDLEGVEFVQVIGSTN